MERDPAQLIGAPPWACPVCGAALAQADGGRRWSCPAGHSHDVAREGYVNLLVSGQRRSRRPGDSDEMVDARRRFLATGAYDPLTAALGRLAAAAGPDAVVLDVGCGEGHHTRGVAAVLDGAVVAGVDVARRAVSQAARAHPGGWYAVASAGALPVLTASVDVALDVFGPVVAPELARVVRPGGSVIAAHPGGGHLASLRALVYPAAQPHDVKPPLRDARAWFEPTGGDDVTFSVTTTDAATLADLFTMTPYRWHAPPDIGLRIAEAAGRGFATTAEVVITTYRRVAGP